MLHGANTDHTCCAQPTVLQTQTNYLTLSNMYFPEGQDTVMQLLLSTIELCKAFCCNCWCVSVHEQVRDELEMCELELGVAWEASQHIACIEKQTLISLNILEL